MVAARLGLPEVPAESAIERLRCHAHCQTPSRQYLSPQRAEGQLSRAHLRIDSHQRFA